MSPWEQQDPLAVRSAVMGSGVHVGGAVGTACAISTGCGAEALHATKKPTISTKDDDCYGGPTVRGAWHG